MSTRPIQENYAIQSPGGDGLERFQARRRKLLGIALIVIGSVWLSASLSGTLHESFMPLDWIVGALATMTAIHVDVLMLSMALVACGMLAASAIRRAR